MVLSPIGRSINIVIIDNKLHRNCLLSMESLAVSSCPNRTFQLSKESMAMVSLCDLPCRILIDSPTALGRRLVSFFQQWCLPVMFFNIYSRRAPRINYTVLWLLSVSSYKWKIGFLLWILCKTDRG